MELITQITVFYIKVTQEEGNEIITFKEDKNSMYLSNLLSL